MTPLQIQAVKDSFERAMSARDELGKSFYYHLFSIAPELQPMFPDDMRAQHNKLVDTLAYTVGHMEQGAFLLGLMRDMAQRHVSYGAKPEHFALVGVALIHALKLHARDGLSDFEVEAWLDAYGWISDVMIDAMAEAA